jgi:hypothetical protein
MSSAFCADTAIIFSAASRREQELAGLGECLGRPMAPALTAEEQRMLRQAAIATTSSPSSSFGDHRTLWRRLDQRLSDSLLLLGSSSSSEEAAADALARDVRGPTTTTSFFGPDVLVMHEVALSLARAATALAPGPAAAAAFAVANETVDPRLAAHCARASAEAGAAVARCLVLDAPCARQDLLASAHHISWTHGLLDPRLDALLAARAVELAAPCVPLLEGAIERARRQGGRGARNDKADELERRGRLLMEIVRFLRQASRKGAGAGAGARSPLPPLLALRRVEHAVATLGEASDVAALAAAAAGEGPAPSRGRRCSLAACASNTWRPAAAGPGEEPRRHRCARCSSAVYCDKACQKEAWDRHRLLCALLAREQQQQQQAEERRRRQSGPDA